MNYKEGVKMNKKAQMDALARNKFLVILLLLIFAVVIIIWMAGLRHDMLNIITRFFG